MEPKNNPAIRLFETKYGLKSVPQTQTPKPAQDYFANEKLPGPIKGYDVYITEAGPVIERRPRVEWGPEHDRKLDGIVAEAKASIDENGYYMRGALDRAKDLARETTLDKDAIFDRFQTRFAETHGQSAGEAVKGWRRERGLPVEEREARQAPVQGHEPEF